MPLNMIAASSHKASESMAWIRLDTTPLHRASSGSQGWSEAGEHSEATILLLGAKRHTQAASSMAGGSHGLCAGGQKSLTRRHGSDGCCSTLHVIPSNAGSLGGVSLALAVVTVDANKSISESSLKRVLTEKSHYLAFIGSQQSFHGRTAEEKRNRLISRNRRSRISYF